MLKNDGSICWQVGIFVHGLHCSLRFSGCCEVILWFMKSDSYTFNLDDLDTEVWNIPNVKNNHPGKL
ncbi:MAG: hypothetical protein IJR85_04010 [Synergistaceae bacterium]|nr:hypothetical protein [Synergistaceae bacterium]